MRRSLLIGLSVLGLHPLTADAQIIRGQIVEDRTNAPVEGAMVVLLDFEGTLVHRVLSDASGSFILDADHPGPHLIRVDRIGYESVTTQRFDVPVGGTFQRITVPIRPVELTGIQVEGSRRCQLRGDQGAATARAWEEARKALEAATWTLESGAYRYTLLQFDRQLEPDARTVRQESRRFIRGTGQAPYRSEPAAELVEEGFMRTQEDGSMLYLAPDAAAFLSDAFLDTHCMRLASVRDGELGLEFEPVRGRRLPDIRGTLWIEAATAHLRRLEFEYVNRPRDHDMGDAGGEIVFGPLPNGAWVVREWGIRMPILAADARRTRVLVDSYQVQGGVVWRVIDGDGTTVLEAATATVGGNVVDSTGVGPVEGAVVQAEDGSAESVTEASGSFLLPGLPGGLQGVNVRHPSLDSLRLGPMHYDVEARVGEVTSHRLRLPGVEELLLEDCSGTPGADEETAVVLGRVGAGAEPVAGTTVRFRWLGQRRGFEATAIAAPERGGAEPLLWRNDEDDPRYLATTLDTRGIFMVCGVPTRSRMSIEVVAGDERHIETVTLPSGARVLVVPLPLPGSR